jgi:cyanophycinase
MVEVDRALLAGRPARAVILPTAAAEEGEESVRRWLDLGSRHFERLGVEPVPLPVLTREDAARPDFAELVAGAGLVYLSGGNPGYLASVLRDSAVWSAIVAAWQGGAALAGCSAGACALTYVAEDVRAMRAAADAGAPRSASASRAASAVGAGPEPTGLAAIAEVAVIPHFDRMARWAPDIADRFASRVPEDVTVVGVDEDTAIVTTDAAGGNDGAGGGRHFTVAGRQSAWVLDRDGHRTGYPAGSGFSVPSAEGCADRHTRASDEPAGR